MSETVLRFFLTELGTVRVHCQMGCGTIIEIPVDQLDQKYPAGECPVCQKTMLPHQSNHLKKLAEALRSLRQSKDRVKVEFVLPGEKK